MTEATLGLRRHLRWIRRLPGMPGPNPRLKPAFWHEYYWMLRTLTLEMQRVVAALPPAKTLLDLGSASCPYRPLFADKIRNYWAADLPGGRGANVIIAPQGSFPFAPASVDVVLSSQVLEHVEDPAGHLAEIRRILAPGGSLILSTHGTWIYHPHPADYWRWTAAGLRKLLVDSGFAIESLRGVLSLRATCVQVWQVLTQRGWPSPVRPLFISVMQVLVALEDWAGRRSRDEDACTYVVHARRL